MTIATRLKDFIDRKGISYDTVAHHRTSTSRQSAIAAHIPGSIVAKSVVVHHELGYALAVVPSTHRIELGTLQDVMIPTAAMAGSAGEFLTSKACLQEVSSPASRLRLIS